MRGGKVIYANCVIKVHNGKKKHDWLDKCQHCGKYYGESDDSFSQQAALQLTQPYGNLAYLQITKTPF